MRNEFVLVAAFLLIAATCDAAEDPCTVAAPESLRSEVVKKFPKYRPPLSTDNTQDHIEWSLREGGNGCWGVAAADFDGVNGKDYVLGLTSRTGSGYLVVVALTQKSGWKFHALSEQAEGRLGLFVAAAKPATYKRTESLDGGVEPGEELTLRCPHWAAEYGILESSAVVACYSKTGWRHVWVAD